MMRLIVAGIICAILGLLIIIFLMALLSVEKKQKGGLKDETKDQI